MNHLARALLASEFKPGDTIYVGTDKKGFTFTNTKPKQESKPPKIDKPKVKSDKVKTLEKATKEVQDAVKDIKKEDKK